MRLALFAVLAAAASCSDGPTGTPVDCSKVTRPTTPCPWSSRTVVASDSSPTAPSGCKNDPIDLPSGVDVCQMRVYRAAGTEEGGVTELAPSDWSTDGAHLWWTDETVNSCDSAGYVDIAITVGCRIEGVKYALCNTGICRGGKCPCEGDEDGTLAYSLVDDSGKPVQVYCDVMIDSHRVLDTCGVK